MAKTIGVVLSNRVLAGLVVDHERVGELCCFPEGDEQDALVEVPTEGLVKLICERIVEGAHGAKDIAAVGIALPGLVRNGVVEDAPNLPQLKGARVQELI